MTVSNVQSISLALEAWQEPSSGLSLGAMNAVQNVEEHNNQLLIELVFGFPVALQKAAITAQISEHLQASLGEQFDSLALNINISHTVAAVQRQTSVAALAGVKNIIAIASGKGGVGKSATTINLALALRDEGARVGVLDADIYGPSQPVMLGIAEHTKPEIKEQKYFVPIEAHGLQNMSMGYMVTEKTPMVWRGPMVSSALVQMVNQTLWNDLDYLLIDMPPGTGDIQLTLAQQVPCSGAVIVTTPQTIALLDAQKGIEMFTKVQIPCLGIVENMATYICEKCGNEAHIFGSEGGKKIAEEYKVPLLGSMPLDPAIREGLDKGQPLVSSKPESATTELYRAIARKMAVQLYKASIGSAQAAPTISIADD
jgi:ATP-binding protein involved in chromosome partitioning